MMITFHLKEILKNRKSLIALPPVILMYPHVYEFQFLHLFFQYTTPPRKLQDTKLPLAPGMGV